MQDDPERALDLSNALSVLRRGGVVGYPSETVWGLAALPESAAGVERLYQLKGRAAAKPVQLSCVSAAEAQRWIAPDLSAAERHAWERLTRCWPGPLTLLVRAASGVPERLAPGGVVGLRVPDHPLAAALLTAAGGTLATTSLNPSAQPAATSWQMAQGYALADLLLRDDAPVSGQASTVYDLHRAQVLREGSLTALQLQALL